MSGIWVFKMQMGPLMGNMRKTFGIRVKHFNQCDVRINLVKNCHVNQESPE